MGKSRYRSEVKQRVVAIVQARMGSTRFPGKMLADLGGHPLLEWVLHRVTRATMIDETILATSTHSRDDPLAELAKKCSVRVYRGDESDVLGRFVGAAGISEADRVVRVCADNPFVDPGEIDRLVDFFDSANSDYACNHLERPGSRYADGFGAEILCADLLQQVAAKATEEAHREHVTSYLWDHAKDYRLTAVPAPRALAHPELSFDVDAPADLARLESLVAAGVDLDTTAGRIVELALIHGVRLKAI